MTVTTINAVIVALGTSFTHFGSQIKAMSDNGLQLTSKFLNCNNFCVKNQLNDHRLFNQKMMAAAFRSALSQ